MNGKSEKDSNNLLCDKRPRGAVKWVEYRWESIELHLKSQKEVENNTSPENFCAQ